MSLDTQPPTPHLTPADLALPYARGGGGALPYERGRDARRKLLTPKNDHFKLWLQESSK